MEFSLKNWLLAEAAKPQVVKPGDQLPDVPPQTANWILSLLSPAERQQLGSSKGGRSKKNYVSSDLWVKLREFLYTVSARKQPGLKREMTANTPGETLHLLKQPEVKKWHNSVRNFKIPPGHDTVVMVPCAKSKPWDTCTNPKLLYGSYNKLRNELGNTYFVTISEPLGIVPQNHWGDFPSYDNPGLFEDTPSQTSFFAADWKALGLQPMEVPFDPSAKAQAIELLAHVIADFAKSNQRPGMRWMSFVEEDSKGLATHSNMLDTANKIFPFLDTTSRYAKRPAKRTPPYDYMRGILTGGQNGGIRRDGVSGGG